MTFQRVIVCLAMVMGGLFGCGPAGGGSGGSGGGTGGSGGSGGSSTTTVTTTTTSTGGSVGGSGGSGGSVEPACGASVPNACSYPEAALGFDPGEGDAGPVYPYTGRAELGGNASCMGPFDADRTFTRALVGFPGPVPGTIALDVWTQDGRDPGERVPSWTARTLVDTSEMAGLTHLRLPSCRDAPARSGDEHPTFVSVALTFGSPSATS